MFLKPSDSKEHQIMHLKSALEIKKSPGAEKTSHLKGTVSRDNLYSIFFIDHILLVLLEVIYEDFKVRRIFAVLFNQKGNSPV